MRGGRAKVVPALAAPQAQLAQEVVTDPVRSDELTFRPAETRRRSHGAI
jgi:hypothetical protein